MLQDLRYALRQLLRRPGFTAAVVLTFALGIGANTAIFSLLHAVLLRPLPFAEPDRLVMVWEHRGGSRDANIPVSGHEYVAWKERNRVFSSLALIRRESRVLTDLGEPETVEVLRVSADFFPLLGVAPVLGRPIAPGEDAAGSHPVAVLSDRFWRDRFGGDPRVVGSTLTLDDRGFTVIGVMPPFPASLSPAVWLPLDVAGEAQAVGRHNLQVIARVKPGVTREQTRADMDRIAAELERELPRENTDHGVTVIPLREDVAGALRLPLLLLLAAVGFVLLIACVNVANLLLARASGRQRELAVRSALGAGRARLAGQLLLECILLAALGGGLGLLLAAWMVDLAPRLTAVQIPFADLARVDLTMFGVALGLSLLAGLGAGLGPALQMSRPAWIGGLGEGIRVSENRERRRLGSALVAAEVALALMLLVGAGLMINSFVRLVGVHPGFTTRNVLVLPVDLPAARYPRAEERREFLDRLLAGLQGLPGMLAAGATSHLPLGGSDNWMPFAIDGRPEPLPGQELSAPFRVVTPDYFQALGIPLVRGRFFTAADARLSVPVIRWYPEQPFPPHADVPQAAPVVIISEAAARQYWPGEDPIGRRIRVLFSPEATIVGVVGDIRHNALNAPTRPHIYLPHAQEPWGSASVVIRSSVPPARQVKAVRARLHALDPRLPARFGTMEDVLSGSVGQHRFYVVLVGLFGLVALGLAVVGVVGVVGHTAARRTTEIGVRMALGAQPADILRLIVGQGMRPILAGISIGTVGALALTRFLERLLFEVRPADVPTYAGVALLMLSVALLACWIPARRVTRIHPVEALRHE